MKDLWKSGVLVIIIIGVLYVLYLKECKHSIPSIKEDEMIIKKVVWDSLMALANKPPEVRIDTVWKKGDVVYVPAKPLPKPIVDKDSIKVYTDSLVNDSIDVHYDFEIKGTLLSRNWRFSPVIVTIRHDSIVYVPKLVTIQDPLAKPLNRLYGNITFGGNENSFIFGGGVDLVTKKQTELGYMYQRFGSNNLHSIRFGTVIRFRK